VTWHGTQSPMSITNDRLIVNFCHCTHLLQVNIDLLFIGALQPSNAYHLACIVNIPNVNVTSFFQSYKARSIGMLSVSLAFCQTQVYTARPLASHVVSAYAPDLPDYFA